MILASSHACISLCRGVLWPVSLGEWSSLVPDLEFNPLATFTGRVTLANLNPSRGMRSTQKSDFALRCHRESFCHRMTHQRTSLLEEEGFEERSGSTPRPSRQGLRMFWIIWPQVGTLHQKTAWLTPTPTPKTKIKCCSKAMKSQHSLLSSKRWSQSLCV